MPRKVEKQVYNPIVDLQGLQKKRIWHLKSRIMMSNRIIHTVACSLGYQANQGESKRTEKFNEARLLIKRILNDEVASDMHSIVTSGMEAVRIFDEHVTDLESRMTEIAQGLPVAPWVKHSDQAGFGFKSLAVVIGETGDLNNYPNPAKVWKRLACAPFTGQVKGEDRTLMGSTWRFGKEGKLSAEEWEEYGYSPRRRSVMYVIGECLIKLNGTGPYRSRYIEAKVRVHETHPEWSWKPCDKKCKNGKINRRKCPTCGGTGEKCLRAHRHGMLLATKLLLKNLWIEWTQ